MAVRVGIVAGEVSGDMLGAGLMKAMKAVTPCTFEGICGPAMTAEGGLSQFPMEALSVMGISEVAGRLRDLLRIRRDLIAYFRRTRPDVVIGIDAPDFTLALERALRRDGIRTVHYVSPTVWAWRRYRVRTVAASTDRLLTLFPFEPEYYAGRADAVFVGHPLADAIEAQPSPDKARDELRLDGRGPVIALLPGSRVTELRAHARLFVKTAQRLALRYPDSRFVAPFVNRETLALFDKTLTELQAFDLPITRLHGHARQAMAAADVVLLASGTAALEAALVGRPMVVVHRLSPITYGLARLLLQVPYVSLPNLLLGRGVVPELLQHAATADGLVRAAEGLLENPGRRAEMTAAFVELRAHLGCGASERAAAAVLELVGAHSTPSGVMSCAS
ncbi:lipid-A-disaccharide synthase [Acidiferrobacter thiooxydans]|uniref:lipid-A-disaccharide synthase n=1 Tax=Acidiferrobacter thiooxydans TaxID=163359 RepID=UPI000824955B|nr:lipid-A-disaccharide synthase [Acidiferrobacter thiooxydans]UEO00948.1 lipid-A-disaccharide synthase [Acidiferrobacter thiooxydans]